jgi:glutamate synthase domain-containing protein 1
MAKINAVFLFQKFGGKMLREGEIRIPSGCAVAAVFNKNGRAADASAVIKSIAVMHDRSNGLGGGFAGYGIYPEYKDLFALHIFYDSAAAKAKCEEYIKNKFKIENMSEIPTAPHKNIKDIPKIWRYFVKPQNMGQNTDENSYTCENVFYINSSIKGAYVFSSGKNMGIFKAVGFPEDVGEFYMLDRYKGYCWTAHGRYPTNTPGWWGGAHPFGLLDLSVVHNGEISSYDANRRYIEMFGYKCMLLTDTEVITYILDFLVRKKGLKMNEAANVIAAPFWQTINNMEKDKKEYYTYLRMAFPSLLITGPFSILVGFDGGIMALNDRLKLRSLVVAEKGDTVYFASEEAAIRVIEPSPDRVFAPKGGQPVIVTLDDKGE